MCVEFTTRVWKYSKAQNGERLVMLAIADFADDEGRAYPSVFRLQKKTLLSERAIRSAIKALKEAGELRVSDATGPKGCNEYFIQIGADGRRIGKGAKSAPLQNQHPANPQGGVQYLPQRGADSANDHEGDPYHKSAPNTSYIEPSLDPRIERSARDLSSNSDPSSLVAALPDDPAGRLATLFLKTWEAAYRRPPTTNHGKLRIQFCRMLDAGFSESDCDAITAFYLADTADEFWTSQAHPAGLLFSQWDRIAQWVQQGGRPAPGTGSGRSKRKTADEAFQDAVADTQAMFDDILENGDEFTKLKNARLQRENHEQQKGFR